jgi:hypothetical protein
MYSTKCVLNVGEADRVSCGSDILCFDQHRSDGDLAHACHWIEQRPCQKPQPNPPAPARLRNLPMFSSAIRSVVPPIQPHRTHVSPRPWVIGLSPGTYQSPSLYAHLRRSQSVVGGNSFVLFSISSLHPLTPSSQKWSGHLPLSPLPTHSFQ